MHFLVFQHIPVEHPGIFRDFMTKDNITWDTIELDEGDSIPELDNYDALIVMGGPMDVWEEDKHSWLITEKEAIRKAIVDFKLPYLGICLGHQLMADALGGKVSKMPEPEVGILNIELTGDGRNASLFSGLQNNIKSLQWHGAEVTEAPPGSRVLAKSPVCATQALQYGDSAFSLQCHVELTDKTVSEWGEVPEYEQSLEQTLGSGSLEKLNIEAEKYIIDFNNSARLIYNNFIAQLEMHST